MIGHASGSNPICPEETAGFVLIDFGVRTTLFRFVVDVTDPVQVESDVCPFVNPTRSPSLGIATPSVSEKLVPKTESKVLLEQKTPKSKLSPSAPTPASATIWSATLA